MLGIKRMFARVQTNAALTRDQANVSVVRSIFLFSVFFGVWLRAHPGAFYPGVSISWLSPRLPPVLLALAAWLYYGVVGWHR